jgi:hypothetical protein
LGGSRLMIQAQNRRNRPPESKSVTLSKGTTFLDWFLRDDIFYK